MKRSIRAYVFETNSSMMHALAYVEGDIFEQWKSGDLLICLHGISLDVETEDAWAEIPCIGWDDVEELTEEEIEQECQSPGIEIPGLCEEHIVFPFEPGMDNPSG